MFRNFLASFFLVVFLLLASPLLFVGSFIFSYGNVDFVKQHIVPRSYEFVLPRFITIFTREFSEPINPKGFEAWLKQEFSKETYVGLVNQAIAEITRLSISQERIEINMKDTKKTFIQAVLRAFQRLPTCPEGILKIKTEGFPTCLPQNFPLEQKEAALHAIQENLEVSIPVRFVFENPPGLLRPEQFTAVKPYFRFSKYVIATLFFLPLLLIGVILLGSWRKLVRFEAIALFFGALESFGLFWFFRQMPVFIKRFKELSEIEEAGITFFLSFPSKILFGVSIILFLTSLALFFLWSRLSPQQELVDEKEVSSPLIIRSGKLRKGTHKQTQSI